MRRAYGFLILSLTGLCGAVAVPVQEEPTADKVFKNIVSFKGSKASDLIPAMRFMNASLKVDCTFCHTEDRSSDEKGPKRAAREMIAMQREINEKNFGGRNQVTCATCHAGHTHPISLSPAIGVEIRPRRSQTVKPDEVLAAYGKAVGAENAKALTGLMLKGSSTTGGVKSSLEETHQGGNFSVMSKTAKGTLKQGFNGTVGWITTDKGVQSFPLIYAKPFINEKTIYIGPDSLPKLTGLGGATAVIDGKDVLVVSGSTEDKTRVTLYFDKKSGLLSRLMFAYPSILGSTAQTNDYSNYRSVQGVMLPMKVVNHSPEGETTREFRSAKVDGSITATSFDPPKN